MLVGTVEARKQQRRCPDRNHTPYGRAGFSCGILCEKDLNCTWEKKHLATTFI